jgi:hypothetical protein
MEIRKTNDSDMYLEGLSGKLGRMSNLVFNKMPHELVRPKRRRVAKWRRCSTADFFSSFLLR